MSNGCVLAPVVVGEETMGYLAIVKSGGGESAADEVDLLAAQHAANVYALALMRQHITAEVSAELKDELIEGLLTGQVTDQQAATSACADLATTMPSPIERCPGAVRGDGLPDRQRAQDAVDRIEAAARARRASPG